MCLHNIVVAVSALYNRSFDIVAVVVAAAAAHECIPEIRKGIGAVVEDKTSAVACIARTSALNEMFLGSNIHPPHTRTLHSSQSDYRYQHQQHHLFYHLTWKDFSI